MNVAVVGSLSLDSVAGGAPRIGGCPFYIGKAQYEYWRHTQLIIDVIEGTLGKAFADAIEDAGQAPVDALRSMGAGRLATFRFALLPQIKAPFVSAIFYILERNVRMATVVGIVGAGGIGQDVGRLCAALGARVVGTRRSAGAGALALDAAKNCLHHLENVDEPADWLTAW